MQVGSNWKELNNLFWLSCCNYQSCIWPAPAENKLEAYEFFSSVITKELVTTYYKSWLNHLSCHLNQQLTIDGILFLLNSQHYAVKIVFCFLVWHCSSSQRKNRYQNFKSLHVWTLPTHFPLIENKKRYACSNVQELLSQGNIWSFCHDEPHKEISHSKAWKNS